MKTAFAPARAPPAKPSGMKDSKGKDQMGGVIRMADDFGDDAGDKLLDWSIRIMVERGRHHAYASSSKLAGALRNAQGRVMEGSGAPMPEAVEREGWAKLDLHEFTGIDGWNDLKEIMDKDLVARGIVHEWFEDASDGRRYLLFRTAEAKDLSDAFGNLADRVEKAYEQAVRAMERAREIGRDDPEPEQRGEGAGKADPRKEKRLQERVRTVRRYAEEARGPERETRETGRVEKRERGRV